MKGITTTIKYFFGLTLILLACEDKISPELQEAAPVFVVDAWINNKPGPQTIILTKSQTYFDSTLPPGVSGATVKVQDSQGNMFNFVEDINRPGYYVWTPVAAEDFGTIGNTYQLNISILEETLIASCKMGRVPLIDSITYDTDKRLNSSDLISRGQFWATDPKGVGDAYWIRTYKNGVLLNKPNEINIAFDGGFSQGGATDGVVFITPVRRGINSNDVDENGRRYSPIEPGDSLQVQLMSISQEAFNHLNEVKIQTNRPGGFSELFSRPLANVSTNVQNLNPLGTKAQGFFNVAAVSTAGKRFKQ